MKTLSVLFLFVAALSISGIAQTEKLVAIFGDSQNIWTMNEKESVSVFEMKVSEKQMSEIRLNANALGTGLSLEVSPKEGNPTTYQFILKVPYVTELSYLHKMFTFFGISAYSVQGIEKPISQLLDVTH